MAAAAAAVSTDPPRCPTRASKAAVGLAASVVSRRRDVAARDAIRRTWCETARAVSRDDAVVVVRFFVGRDPDPGGADDLDRGDVTLVDVVDSPFAVLRLRLHALLSLVRLPRTPTGDRRFFFCSRCLLVASCNS